MTRVGKDTTGATMPTLCESCQQVRQIRTARSTFLLCQLAITNVAFPKYPPQPVRACHLFKPRPPQAGPDSDGSAGESR